ncbi:MAG TPA: hypothetical protein VF785_23220 [Gemmatimonadaceae bacterium]
MHHEDISEYDNDDVLRQLAELPRTTPLDAGETDRIVARLRQEGFFRARTRTLRWTIQAAAAAAIFAVGAFAGSRYAHRNSLEEILARTDLTVADRVLLLQRAGSAYVRAAQSYADATAHVDSGAVEVASRVLLGAAHAVARSSLDAGLSERLTTAMQPVAAPMPAAPKPVIWF